MHDLASTASPFDRNNFAPGHFTASAFVVDPKTHSLLLILHRKLGLWLQPGGHIDPGDELAALAARREVMEETGVSELSPLFGNAGIFDVDITRSRRANTSRGTSTSTCASHLPRRIRLSARATKWPGALGAARGVAYIDQRRVGAARRAKIAVARRVNAAVRPAIRPSDEARLRRRHFSGNR